MRWGGPGNLIGIVDDNEDSLKALKENNSTYLPYANWFYAINYWLKR
jgi:hypothetical protein